MRSCVMCTHFNNTHTETVPEHRVKGESNNDEINKKK